MTGVRERGLTLIELLVTLSIAAILLAMALPNFSRLLSSNRAQTQSELIARSLNYARAEAVRLGAKVYVSSISTTTDWSQGWRIWADQAGGTAGTYESGEEIQVQGALANGSALTGPAATISFEPTGFISGADDSGKFVNSAAFSYSMAGSFYCTSVSHVGRVSYRKTTDTTCP